MPEPSPVIRVTKNAIPAISTLPMLETSRRSNVIFWLKKSMSSVKREVSILSLLTKSSLRVDLFISEFAVKGA
jgi:hypothetical protein